MSKKQYKYIFLYLISFFFLQDAIGQKEENKSPKYLLFNLQYSLQQPGGDMGDRYGANNAVGLGLEFLSRGNFIIGLSGDLLFGKTVEEDVLATLRNSDGSIIGNNRALSAITLRERGINVNLLLGKLWNINKKQPKSGIRTTIGGGILQHKIRIQQDPQSLVPQAEGEYAKGYDRLSNGFALTEFIGYQMVSRNKRLNFIAGFEFVQGFTKNRRAFNFDTMMKDDESKFDTLIGIKFGWTLPFQIGVAKEEVFYVPGK